MLIYLYSTWHLARHPMGGLHCFLPSGQSQGFHVMHPALDRSTSKDRVFMSIPWHFYEQAKANQKQAPMKWMSSGFSELIWTKMASAGPGETDPRKVWRISDYRVILLANSPDNCAGGLDYDN